MCIVLCQYLIQILQPPIPWGLSKTQLVVIFIKIFCIFQSLESNKSEMPNRLSNVAKLFKKESHIEMWPFNLCFYLNNKLSCSNKLVSLGIFAISAMRLLRQSVILSPGSQTDLFSAFSVASTILTAFFSSNSVQRI